MPLFSLIVALAVCAVASKAGASVCTDWGDCELALGVDYTLEVGYETYLLTDESTHFVVFHDPASPNAVALPPADLQVVVDELECAYRYQICELGLVPPSTDKLHVYIDDATSSAGPKGFMTLNAGILGPGDFVYTTTHHELYHVVESGYTWSSYELFTEARATMVEGLASEQSFDSHLRRVDRVGEFYDPGGFGLGAYKKNLFWRFLLEQLEGLPADLNDINASYAVSDALEDTLLEQANLKLTLGRNPTINEFLEAYVPTRRNRVDSLTCDVPSLLEDYATMRYAFRHVALEDQPEYTMLNQADYIAAAPFSTVFWETSGSTITTSPTVFANVPEGFPVFMSGEYHKFDLDSCVDGVEIEKTVFDDFLRFQIILKMSDGTVDVRDVLETSTIETVSLESFKADIVEMVLVIYTVNDNPVTTGMGRLYSVSVTGLEGLSCGMPTLDPPPFGDLLVGTSMYGLDSACDCLYSIASSGTTTEIGALAQDVGEVFAAPTSMASDLGGNLYTVDNVTGSLLSIDRATGDADVVCTGLGQTAGLAVNPVDVPGPAASIIPAGSLFASDRDLTIIDPTVDPCGVTVVGSTGTTFPVAGLAFRSDGTLYGVELDVANSCEQLLEVSTETGMGTGLGPIRRDFGAIGSLVFDANDDLWAADLHGYAATYELAQIDLDTMNIVRRIVVSDTRRPQGLALLTAPQNVPTLAPWSTALLILLLAGVGLRYAWNKHQATI